MILDKTSFSVLERLYEKKRCTLHEISELTGHDESDRVSKYIMNLGRYIDRWTSDELNEHGENKLLGYEINLRGEAFIEQERASNADKVSARRRDVINLIIALLALIVSIIALFRGC